MSANEEPAEENVDGDQENVDGEGEGEQEKTESAEKLGELSQQKSGEHIEATQSKRLQETEPSVQVHFYYFLEMFC